jgi:hypothetical protein
MTMTYGDYNLPVSEKTNPIKANMPGFARKSEAPPENALWRNMKSETS